MLESFARDVALAARRLARRPGVCVTAAGLALGLLGAFLSARVLSALLYGVGPTDGVTLAAASALLLAVALLACVIPARRTLRMDPVAALRHE